jgi:plasmid stabilization system protein ParE
VGGGAGRAVPKRPYSGFQTIVNRPELRRAFHEIPPYFRALVSKHVVFYRTEPDGTILIVRVLHAAMLPELHLPVNDKD